ncbi:MAG: CYTH domain-containing protein [Flavobacteriaceae bacterium]
MIEIERKYLIKTDAYKTDATSYAHIVQGFLNTNPERTVRVRIYGDTGYLTIKGKSNKAGTTRFEWEKEISLNEAKALLKLCEEGILEKTRYLIPHNHHIFEVDEFHGDNQGLVIAEIELRDDNEIFAKPVWLGEEVTGEVKYYNSQLSKKTFKSWKK